MKEKRILEVLGEVDEMYINEANPCNDSKKNKFAAGWLAVAACLCIIICGGIGISLYNANTSKEKKYYNTNIEEVSALYEGVLLAKNLSYDEAYNTKIQLCYTGEGLPFSESEWEKLTVSANYEDYDLTMDCTFNGDEVNVEGGDAIEKIEFGETTVFLYQAEPQADYDLSYYAVFEYENVLYELQTYTNEEKRIYEILETVLGDPGMENSGTEENQGTSSKKFESVLGFEDYYVKVDEVSPGFIIQNYYAKINGVDTKIAEVYGYVVPEPEVYSKDLDGDGVEELICNCMAGTGAARVRVYRNKDGVIERGSLVYDSWDKTLFPGIHDQSSSAIAEKYMPDNNTFKVTYYTKDGMASVTFKGLEVMEFRPIEEDM